MYSPGEIDRETDRNYIYTHPGEIHISISFAANNRKIFRKTGRFEHKMLRKNAIYHSLIYHGLAKSGVRDLKGPRGERMLSLLCVECAAQSQKTVTAHFSSEQLLFLCLAEQCRLTLWAPLWSQMPGIFGDKIPSYVWTIWTINTQDHKYLWINCLVHASSQ